MSKLEEPREGVKVGMTFGAFDGLHVGHLKLLKSASENCDKLVVCLSSDKYIKERKGHNPMFNFSDRVDHLLEFAGEYAKCISFQGDNFSKECAIREYKPDVLFVGSDWTPETYTGEGLGVPVVYLPHTGGISSSLLRKKL